MNCLVEKAKVGSVLSKSRKSQGRFRGRVRSAEHTVEGTSLAFPLIEQQLENIEKDKLGNRGT